MDAKDILKEINNRVRDEGKLVVGIDGYSGIGKTTLLNKLIENNKDILAVCRDDFIKPRKVIKNLLENADDKSKIMELEFYDDQKIRELVNKFRNSDELYTVKVYNSDTGKVDTDKTKTYNLSKKILIIEGIFLFHPKLIKDVFDLKIFINGDMEVADQRRIKREKAKWGKDYFPHDHPDSYFRLVKIAFERYSKLYNPKESADIVVDF